MSNPNGGGIPSSSPSATPSLPDLIIPLDPEVEELWSSRALLLVSLTLASPRCWAGREGKGCRTAGSARMRRNAWSSS